MTANRSHTTLLYRCLLLLGVAMLCLTISDSTSNIGVNSYQLPQNTVDSGLVHVDDFDESSEKPDSTGTFFNQEFKETPRQQPTVSAPNSLTVSKKGNSSLESDSKDLSQKTSLLNQVIKLLPEEVRNATIFRLTIQILHDFLSLPGDIAINAP